MADPRDKSSDIDVLSESNKLAANKKRNDELEQAKREAFAEQCRNFALTKCEHREWKNIEGDKDEKSFSLGAVTSGETRQLLKPGVYTITDIRYNKKNTNPFRIRIEENNGMLYASPERSHTTTEDYERHIDGIISTYTAGLGMSRLRLDFPNAARVGPHLRESQNICENIKLEHIKTALETAKKYGAMLTFSPMVEKRLALVNAIETRSELGKMMKGIIPSWGDKRVKREEALIEKIAKLRKEMEMEYRNRHGVHDAKYMDAHLKAELPENTKKLTNAESALSTSLEKPGVLESDVKKQVTAVRESLDKVRGNLNEIKGIQDFSGGDKEVLADYKKLVDEAEPLIKNASDNIKTALESDKLTAKLTSEDSKNAVQELKGELEILGEKVKDIHKGFEIEKPKEEMKPEEPEIPLEKKTSPEELPARFEEKLDAYNIMMDDLSGKKDIKPTEVEALEKAANDLIDSKQQLQKAINKGDLSEDVPHDQIEKLEKAIETPGNVQDNHVLAEISKKVADELTEIKPESSLRFKPGG